MRQAGQVQSLPGQYHQARPPQEQAGAVGYIQSDRMGWKGLQEGHLGMKPKLTFFINLSFYLHEDKETQDEQNVQEF